MAASVTHFEIYAEDLTKLAGFYKDLFGWQIDKAPGIDYFQIQTGTAEGGEGIRGGMLHRPIPGPRSWVHYVSVESIDDAIELVQRLGGKLVRPKAAVPKVAWYAVVEDPEGNIFAMWEPDPLAFPPLEPED
jgi:predicted enzyme related to lactoylglutathione lyase